MIRSMTGYGRKEVRVAGSLFTIEIRSVNNRYLDVQIKTPRTLAALEPRFRRAIQERFSRGRFDLFVTKNGGEEKGGRLILDMEMAEQYVNLLKALKERLDLPGEINISLVASAPGIITSVETTDDPEALWLELSQALGEAMDELDGMRTAEGTALARDIEARLGSIESELKTVKGIAPRATEAAATRIKEAVARLAAQAADPSRIAQEIAFLAERMDITEELIRLESHIRQFRDVLKGSKGEPIGRRLDFLLQEMMREVNTAASKASDADISISVVSVKTELEKIREQVQNIE